jgi:hypothetical protein
MNLSSFVAVRLRQKSERAQSSHQTADDGDPVARLARLIYAEMDVEPRQMHVAIQLAKEHLRELREQLVTQGLRRGGSPL